MSESSNLRAFLQVLTGRLAGKTIGLDRESRLRVGQSARANLAIVDDEKMAAVHFYVSWNGETCTFSSAAGMRFVLNGETVEGDATAEHGAVVLAGNTSFLLRIVNADLRAYLPPPPPDVRPCTESLVAARHEALATLQNEAPLFALVDSARDRRILPLLVASNENHASLFEGQKGHNLASVAPYLVQVSPQSPLLEVLVNEGWGASWGVYLVGLRPFHEIRRRLRRSLMVQDAETNKKLYFRFYDPRVLRVFWPACSKRQRSEILGTEMAQFILEGQADELIRLTL